MNHVAFALFLYALALKALVIAVVIAAETKPIPITLTERMAVDG